MNREAVRAYVERRWDLVEREKIRTRARRFANGGHEAALVAARQLRAQWLRLHPEIDPARRRSDLESHIALKKRLDAVAHGLARR